MWLRSIGLAHMANADIAGDALVQNMDLVWRWMRHAEVPSSKPKPKHLKPVNND